MNSKGTILYIGGFEMPDKNAASHRVVANGKLLRSMGYNVVYCGISHDTTVESFETKNYFGFDCYAVPYPSSKIEWIKYIFKSKLFKKIVKKHENVAAIICYNVPSGSLSKMIRFSKKRNIKIFSDCTEWYEAPKAGNFIYKIVKKIDISLRMHTLHFKMDGIISISQYLHQFYSSKGLKSIKVPPLVDLTDEKWNNEISSKSNGIKRYVYSGSPFSLSDTSSVKDRLDLIIVAMAKLKNEGFLINIDIVGIAEQEFLSLYPTLKDEILMLDKCIVFHGRVPHKTSIKILKSSDYSIFLRDVNLVTKAGFPTKFVESISCGIPVLTNDSSNISDYLISGTNGYLVSNTNITNVEEAIKTSLKISDQDLFEMKKNCQQTNIFNYLNYKQEFVSLFE